MGKDTVFEQQIEGLCFTPFSEVFKLTLKLWFNKFVLMVAFLGTPESGCRLMQKEQVDRMMIRNLSVPSKYRWYGV